jgi:hypothetical protein
MAYKRSLVYSIAGGTASQTIQIPVTGRVTKAIFSITPAAAGSWELSKNGTSQIGTTNPDVGVLARARVSAVGPTAPVVFELDVPVKILDNLYLHCTGAGNVGELTLLLG